jgi:hypothetical protein
MKNFIFRGLAAILVASIVPNCSWGTGKPKNRLQRDNVIDREFRHVYSRLNAGDSIVGILEKISIELRDCSELGMPLPTNTKQIRSILRVVNELYNVLYELSSVSTDAINRESDLCKKVDQCVNTILNLSRDVLSGINTWLSLCDPSDVSIIFNKIEADLQADERVSRKDRALGLDNMPSKVKLLRESTQIASLFPDYTEDGISSVDIAQLRLFFNVISYVETQAEWADEGKPVPEKEREISQVATRMYDILTSPQNAR